MKKAYLILITLIICVLTIGCGGSSSGSSEQPPKQDYELAGNYVVSFKSSGICYLTVSTDRTISGVAEDSQGAYTLTGTVNNADSASVQAREDGTTVYTFTLSFSENGVTGTWQSLSDNGQASGSSLTNSGNNDPVILGNPSRAITAGSSYSFTPVAYDYDNDELSFSITGKPAWLSFNAQNGTVSGSPSVGDAGIYNIVITVSDGKGGSSECSFSITVNASNSAPILPSGIQNVTININTLYEEQFTAYDPDGDSITFSATGLPLWLTLNSSSGLLSGTPTGTGVHTITYTATDSHNASSSISYTITVKDPSESGRFTRNDATDIVTDTVTGAMWQDNAIVADWTSVRNWSSSVSYCDGLVFGGYSDWHMPTLEELQTTQGAAGAIDPAFANVVSYTYMPYWTTTQYEDYPTIKMQVTYNSTLPSLGFTGGNALVRCIR